MPATGCPVLSCATRFVLFFDLCLRIELLISCGIVGGKLYVKWARNCLIIWIRNDIGFVNMISFYWDILLLWYLMQWKKIVFQLFSVQWFSIMWGSEVVVQSAIVTGRLLWGLKRLYSLFRHNSHVTCRHFDLPPSILMVRDGVLALGKLCEVTV